MLHPSPAATAGPAGRPVCLDPLPPPIGKRRGNPDLGLAPRCGAHTRGGCPCRAPAIQGKLRCRMHGGRSTGPRTAEGMARLRAARTVHGGYSAETRARNRYDLTALRRGQVGNAAVRCVDRLPADLVGRLMQTAPELVPPPCPSGGLTPAEDRAVLRAEAEALAPWRAAIAQAGLAGWAGRGAKRSAGGSLGAPAEPHAPVPPHGEPAGWGDAAGGVPVEVVAEAHAPVRAGDAGDAGSAAPAAAPAAPQAEVHAPVPSRGEPAGLGDAAGRAPAEAAAEAHAPEHAGEHADDRGGAVPGVPRAAHGRLVQSHAEAHAPERTADVAALAAWLRAAVAAPGKAHAPEHAADRDAAGPAAPPAAHGCPVQPPAEAHAPEGGPPAGAAIPAVLGNRAERRRWKSLQRRALRALASGRRP